MLSIPCLITHENQYFPGKNYPLMSETTLRRLLNPAVANHDRCVSVTLEDGLAGARPLELSRRPPARTRPATASTANRPCPRHRR